MNTLNPGDKVRRVNDDCGFLQVSNRVYTVKKFRAYTCADIPGFYGSVELEGRRGEYDAHRFVVVERAVTIGGVTTAPRQITLEELPVPNGTHPTLKADGNRGGGMKFDSGKPQARLFFEDMPLAFTECMKVMSFAIEKGYKPHSWRDVPNMQERYADALYRHYLARIGGEAADPESKLSHRAHEIINHLFLLERELEDARAKQEA